MHGLSHSSVEGGSDAEHNLRQAYMYIHLIYRVCVLCELVLTVQTLRKQHPTIEPVTYALKPNFSHASYGTGHTASSHIAGYVPVSWLVPAHKVRLRGVTP